jgi:ParB family chromosome partitioning protein
LEKLAGSIRRHGLLQPIVVRSTGDRYEILCGERRWRASALAGLLSIPAVIKDIDDDDRLELALVENVQRADLNPIELAHAFQALGEAGSTQEEIGRQVGMERSTIANHLRLLELPREFQADIEAGKFSMGHAKTLLSVSNPERRRHLRDRIVRESLSVRASEVFARAGSAPKRQQEKSPRVTDPNRQRLIDSLRRRYQTSVRISGDNTRGRVEIEYFGAEDLGRITEILMGDH